MSQFEPVRSILGQNELLQFEMPKVKSNLDFDYVELLQKQGLGIIFDSIKARFTEITDFIPERNLYCGGISQKILFEVDEEKTVIAGITVIRGAQCTGVNGNPPQVVIIMIVDHPYLIVIQDDQTGLILLAGVIRKLKGTPDVAEEGGTP